MTSNQKLIWLFGFGILLLSKSGFAIISNRELFNNFMEQRRIAVASLKSLEEAPTVEGQSSLRNHWRDLKNSYAKLDRTTTKADLLYEAQFQLRFANRHLKTVLSKLSQKGLLKQNEQKQIEMEAHLLDDWSQSFYRSPQKTLPIDGIGGSDWPLSRWENDKEFYKYTFEGDEVVFRGLRLKSGDILLNHPIEKPEGLFTALSEERSVFAHAAVIVFLNKKWGRLPVVVDVHERGIRAVPLHHYLGARVVGYAEVYRFREELTRLAERSEKAAIALMSEEHPYDLTGTEDRKALSCTEMVSFFLELMGEEKMPLGGMFKEAIFKNILRFGKMENQLVQVPNDVFRDARFKYVGYIDNTQTLSIQVINEVLMDLFREKMEYHIAKSRKDLGRLFGEIAIAQIKNRRSVFGGFILGLTGFNRENFPVGDPGLLTAVNAIDFSFKGAMERCLGLQKTFNGSNCEKRLRQWLRKGVARDNYSIHEWKSISGGCPKNS